MDELMQEIKQAFVNTPYPGDIHIGTFELMASFKGRHWKEVSPEMLFFHRFEITSFTAEAFRFYLPAILLAVLQDHKAVDTLTETLVYHLVPSQHGDGEDTSWGKTLKRVIELLSQQEKNAVYKFLLKCRELYPTEGWGYGENSIEELDEAIQFWEILNK